jgi:hypothetical protein
VYQDSAVVSIGKTAAPVDKEDFNTEWLDNPDTNFARIVNADGKPALVYVDDFGDIYYACAH